MLTKTFDLHTNSAQVLARIMLPEDTDMSRKLTVGFETPRVIDDSRNTIFHNPWTTRNTFIDIQWHYWYTPVLKEGEVGWWRSSFSRLRKLKPVDHLATFFVLDLDDTHPVTAKTWGDIDNALRALLEQIRNDQELMHSALEAQIESELAGIQQEIETLLDKLANANSRLKGKEMELAEHKKAPVA